MHKIGKIFGCCLIVVTLLSCTACSGLERLSDNLKDGAEDQYVLHTVGPIVSGHLTDKHCRQLADCYKSCLELAADSGLKSIVFCCISTGEFHFPQKKVAEIAVQTVKEYLNTDTCVEKVVFNVFKQEDYDIYRELIG